MASVESSTSLTRRQGSRRTTSTSKHVRPLRSLLPCRHVARSIALSLSPRRLLSILACNGMFGVPQGGAEIEPPDVSRRVCSSSHDLEMRPLTLSSSLAHLSPTDTTPLPWQTSLSRACPRGI